MSDPLLAPDPAAQLASYGIRWRLDASDAYRLEHQVLRLLGNLIRQGHAPETMAILVPDAYRREDWASACHRANLPVAGVPAHWEAEALAPLETLLRILAGGPGLMALTDAVAALPAPWQAFLDMAGIQGPTPMALLQGLAHLSDVQAPYQDALHRFLEDSTEKLPGAANATGQAWLDHFMARRNQIVWDPSSSGIFIGPPPEDTMPYSVQVLPTLTPWLFGPVPAAQAALKRLMDTLNAADVALVGEAPHDVPWDFKSIVSQWLGSWTTPPDLDNDETPSVPRELLTMAHAYADSPWTASPPASIGAVAQPVAETAPITLSPSSVSTFLKCPRQFFYAHLLQLREPGVSLAALTGTLTHHLLEAFNREAPLPPDPLAWLTARTHALFTALETEADLEATGLHRAELKTLAEFGALQRERLRQQLLDAFQELDDAGYFQQRGRILEVEKALYAEPPEFQGIRLTGRADLLREQPDGTLEVIDYKTTRNRFLNVRPETNMRPMLAALDPVDWEEPDIHRRSTGRDLQLPLYALMLQNQPEYQNRPVAATIQLVRPGTPNPERTAGSACPTFTLPPERLAEGMPHVLDLLRQDVITPLQAMAHFPATGNPALHCGPCPYHITICEGPADAEDWETEA